MYPLIPLPLLFLQAMPNWLDWLANFIGAGGMIGRSWMDSTVALLGGGSLGTLIATGGGTIGHYYNKDTGGPLPDPKDYCFGQNGLIGLLSGVLCWIIGGLIVVFIVLLLLKYAWRKVSEPSSRKR